MFENVKDVLFKLLITRYLSQFAWDTDYITFSLEREHEKVKIFMYVCTRAYIYIYNIQKIFTFLS